MADDGLLYCSWCWAEWSAGDASGEYDYEYEYEHDKGDDHQSQSLQDTSSSSTAYPSTVSQRPPPGLTKPNEAAASTASTSTKKLPQGKRRSERVAFFDGI